MVRILQLGVLSLSLIAAAHTSLRAQSRAMSPALPQAVSPAMPCHGNQQIRQVAELLFGRDIGRRLGVGESAWTRFVAREITPRFPNGLTVSDATGQWRDRATGAITREPSKRVEIILPGATDDEDRLDAVVAAYKRDFHQQSVAVIVRPACVSF